MSFMCTDKNIDAELFILFLQSGVYRQYGDRYLDQAQVDNVNIEHYLYSAAT